jgi:hypothetical protein
MEEKKPANLATGEYPHGKVRRFCTTLSDIQHLIDTKEEWSKMASVGMISSMRKCNGKTTLKTRYFISCLPKDAKSTKRVKSFLPLWYKISNLTKFSALSQISIRVDSASNCILKIKLSNRG